VDRGKSSVFGLNGNNERPEFKRSFEDGKECFVSHAEMDAVSKLRKIYNNDVLYVARFTKDGKVSMAKPCKYCQEYLKRKGISKVRYTDWAGEWQRMTLSNK